MFTLRGWMPWAPHSDTVGTIDPKLGSFGPNSQHPNSTTWPGCRAKHWLTHATLMTRRNPFFPPMAEGFSGLQPQIGNLKQAVHFVEQEIKPQENIVSIFSKVLPSDPPPGPFPAILLSCAPARCSFPIIIWSDNRRAVFLRFKQTLGNTLFMQLNAFMLTQLYDSLTH